MIALLSLGLIFLAIVIHFIFFNFKSHKIMSIQKVKTEGANTNNNANGFNAKNAKANSVKKDQRQIQFALTAEQQSALAKACKTNVEEIDEQLRYFFGVEPGSMVEVETLHDEQGNPAQDTFIYLDKKGIDRKLVFYYSGTDAEMTKTAREVCWKRVNTIDTYAAQKLEAFSNGEPYTYSFKKAGEEIKREITFKSMEEVLEDIKKCAFKSFNIALFKMLGFDYLEKAQEDKTSYYTKNYIPFNGGFSIGEKLKEQNRQITAEETADDDDVTPFDSKEKTPTEVLNGNGAEENDDTTPTKKSGKGTKKGK